MSMYPEEPIDPYLRDLRGSLGSGVTAGVGMSVGLGVFTPSGRQVGVSIREMPSGLVELSDLEETISALVAYEVKIDSAFRVNAARLCKSYGIPWNGRGAITWTGPRSEWVDAAKRICAVSLAIDSWRHWMEAA